MKLTKRVSLVIMSCMLIISSTATSIFAASEKKESPELKALSEKYNLKDVKEVPAGITPMKFDSVEEAEKALIKFKNPTIVEYKSKSDAQISPMAQGSDTASFFYNMSYWKHIQVTYEYLYDTSRGCNYYNTCYSVSSWITGLTLGFDYRQVSSFWNIYNNGLMLTANATGIMDYYLLVDGMIKLFSSTEDIGNNFTNP